MKTKKNEIKFATDSESVKIPTKREEDGGYDVYPYFSEDSIEIPPHTTVMIPTGLYSVFSSDYACVLKERGSTGTKGIAQRCGVIDSGFRGEWKVPITNTTQKTMFISKPLHYRKVVGLENTIVYPYEKAICQFMVVSVPKMEISQIAKNELQQYDSERGKGRLGSSGK